ncbi:MAG: hypothetical protein QOF33_2854 [Thermomicrobiales bacterium]|nr:hypothetical protein [Thermomicrobiales bacterium]
MNDSWLARGGLIPTLRPTAGEGNGGLERRTAVAQSQADCYHLIRSERSTGFGHEDGERDAAVSSGPSSAVPMRVAHEVAGSLNPQQRRERIAEYVLQRDSVTAKELAARFDVSVMTVHRDLDELERQGVLRKVRGGATPQPSSLFESNVRFRLATATAEKEALARYALTLIEPGQAILLDDATTTLCLARLLPAITPLTVITNYLRTIKELAGVPGIRLIALGGEYLPSHDSFVGVVCETAIEALRADVAFLSTSAVSGQVAFHQEQEIVAVKRAMIGVATM